MTALDAVLRRRSQPKVAATAPSRTELAPLVVAAATVADHASLRPFRLIELRGDARAGLGQAFVDATGVTDRAAEKLAAKPLRAELLIAVVAIMRPSIKVDPWEQEATASGVAHVLSLLLDEAGWGVMWRSGHVTRLPAVNEFHGLADNELLLGWLYVGEPVERERRPERPPVSVDEILTAL